MKGQPAEQRRHVSFICEFVSYNDEPADDRVAACLPASYIVDEGIRVEMYRRLSQLNSLKAVDDVGAELVDRFGPMPDAVTHFLMIVRLKIMANKQGIHSISVRDGKVFMEAARGFIKRGGSIPRLNATTPAKKLKELLAVVKK